MRSLRWALWACLVVAGCTRSHSEAGGDSSTHWLHRCGADDQCGGLSCVCGVCSTECGASSECAGLGSSAVCTPSAISACVTGDSAPRLCDQTCQRDQDCGGSGLRCVEQRCRRETSGEQDASPPASADEGGASAASDAGGRDTSTDAGTAPNTLAFLCPAQRARSDGTLCVLPVGYAWNGAACEPVVCGCAGADCASIARTLDECEAAFASCQPSSKCSGLPWYRCNDVCPAHWVLQGGGLRLDECQGDCGFDLRFNPNIVLDAGGCTQLDVDLTIRDARGAERVVNAELTDAAFKQAMLLSLALENAALTPLVPCLDCADPGSSWLSRTNAQAEIETFQYQHDDPPEGLRALDSFIRQLINQVYACRGDLLAHCSSSSSPSAPACGPGSAIADTGCACPATRPLDGTACSASCASCTSGSCGATCIQPCAGGEPVWDEYCSE